MTDDNFVELVRDFFRGPIRGFTRDFFRGFIRDRSATIAPSSWVRMRYHGAHPPLSDNRKTSAHFGQRCVIPLREEAAQEQDSEWGEET